MAHINDTHRLRDLEPATLERYDLAGPRYTSYPTAPEWGGDFGPEAFGEHLALTRGDGADRPLSIYIHLPFCETHCTFCGCNVVISPRREQVSEPYLADLAREVELFADAVDTGRSVAQFHWGGGTPTYLSAEQLRRVHGMVAERFRLAPDAEQSLEVHVNWTTDEQMHALAELGFNRISMGVQDFDERTQQAINRIQSVERTREIIELARKLGFQGINVDLIYGLPHQTVGTFRETVERVIELAPDRLAVYNFAYLPGKLAHQRTIDTTTLPGGPEKFRIFLEAHDRLTAAGYRYIGMDHFARPDDELARAFDDGSMQRNFMGFTTRAGADLIGMGISAISNIHDCFAQNVKKLPAYGRILAGRSFATERGLRLSADDRLRRDVIGSLMCRDHIDKGRIERAHGIEFDEYFADELARLQPMIEDELLTVREDSLDLTFLGRLFVRNIAMVFDGYLKKSKAGRQPVFSRTL